MGIIERARHVIRADLEQLIRKSRNPRLVLEAYLEDLEEILQQACSIRDAEKVEREGYACRLRDLEQAMRTMEDKARACLQSGDEELARAALERKLDLAEQAKELAALVRQHDESLAAIEHSVDTLHQRREEARRRRRELKFRQQVLEARSELQQAISRSRPSGEEPLLQRATEQLAELEGRLQAEELAGSEQGEVPFLRLEADQRRRRRNQLVEQELERLRQSLPKDGMQS